MHDVQKIFTAKHTTHIRYINLTNSEVLERTDINISDAQYLNTQCSVLCQQNVSVTQFKLNVSITTTKCYTYVRSYDLHTTTQDNKQTNTVYDINYCYFCNQCTQFFSCVTEQRWSRNSSVSIVTTLQDVRPGVRIPTGAISSPKRPDRLWGSHSLLFNGYRILFPMGKSGRRVRLTTPPPSSAKVKNARSHPLFLLHAFMACTCTPFLFYRITVNTSHSRKERGFSYKLTSRTLR